MDSTANIENNHVNIRAFVDERTQTFEFILNELRNFVKKI